MNKISVFIAVLGISLAMYSCAKDNNCDTVKVTNASLQGSWKFESEIIPEDFGYYGGGRFLKLTIKEDSFKLISSQYMDYINIECDSMPTRSYSKGVFSVQSDSLKLNGFICNSDFSEKTVGDACNAVGNFSASYKTYFCEDTLRIWGAGYYNQVHISMIKED